MNYSKVFDIQNELSLLSQKGDGVRLKPLKKLMTPDST